MIKVYCDNFQKIARNKKALERNLDVKLNISGKDIEIEGEAVNEYIAEKVINALNFDFPLRTALLIKEEDLEFEILPIKDFTKRHDLKVVKSRIIGKMGKTLKTLQNLTGCFFEIKDNEV
ncbi:MAG: hypothetical protein Q7R52_05705, partial [archaeon]|nr:hypothetical protein [archaeon]